MEISKVLPKNFEKAINKTIKYIQKGKIIVCPRDTVYGLICDAKNEKVIKKLLKIKQREISKPIPIFIKDLEMAKELVNF